MEGKEEKLRIMKGCQRKGSRAILKGRGASMLRAFRGTVFYNRCRQPPLVHASDSLLGFPCLSLSSCAYHVARMRLASVSPRGPLANVHGTPLATSAIPPTTTATGMISDRLSLPSSFSFSVSSETMGGEKKERREGFWRVRHAGGGRWRPTTVALYVHFNTIIWSRTDIQIIYITRLYLWPPEDLKLL